MSQLTATATGMSLGAVMELTGNTGGPVLPTGGNINVVGSGNITVAGNPGTSTLTATIVGTTNHAVQVGNASGSLTSIPVGLTGQVLTGVTGGDPVFASPAASSISITGDTGGALTGNAFTFTGGSTGLKFNGVGTTETLGGTLVVANGGTGFATAAANGVVYGNTTSPLGVTAAGINGNVLIAATGAAPAFAALTSTGGTITFTPGANTLNLEASGTSIITYTPVNSTPYVVLSTDDYLGVDSSGGAITVQLPNAPATGRVFYVKDKTGSAATKNITITTVGGAVNIDGATSFVMNTNYESASIIFNGTSYEIF